MMGIRSFFLLHLCSVFKSHFAKGFDFDACITAQEYGIILVSFHLISVLQNLIQRNASFDFGLRVDYQGQQSGSFYSKYQFMLLKVYQQLNLICET